MQHADETDVVSIQIERAGVAGIKPPSEPADEASTLLLVAHAAKNRFQPFATSGSSATPSTMLDAVLYSTAREVMRLKINRVEAASVDRVWLSAAAVTDSSSTIDGAAVSVSSFFATGTLVSAVRLGDTHLIIHNSVGARTFSDVLSVVVRCTIELGRMSLELDTATVLGGGFELLKLGSRCTMNLGRSTELSQHAHAGTRQLAVVDVTVLNGIFPQTVLVHHGSQQPVFVRVLGVTADGSSLLLEDDLASSFPPGL